MKRLILSLSGIIISVNVIVNAQNVVDNPIIREDLDYMFEKLDKSKIPTGYLLDYAVDLVELDEYNGRNLSEDNYIVYSIYEDLLYSIESASVNRLCLNVGHSTCSIMIFLLNNLHRL